MSDPQHLGRLDARGAPGRIETGYDPQAQYQRESDRDRGGARREGGSADEPRPHDRDQARGETDGSSQSRKGHRLEKNETEDPPRASPQRPLDPDLPTPFRERREHRVRDAGDADEEAERGGAHQDPPDGSVSPASLGEQALGPENRHVRDAPA